SPPRSELTPSRSGCAQETHRSWRRCTTARFCCMSARCPTTGSRPSRTPFMPPSEADASALPLTVGTAGHIAHGKAVRDRALTGVDTDRLPQERERGISIELGFAALELPSGRRV